MSFSPCVVAASLCLCIEVKPSGRSAEARHPWLKMRAIHWYISKVAAKSVETLRQPSALRHAPSSSVLPIIRSGL